MHWVLLAYRLSPIISRIGATRYDHVAQASHDGQDLFSVHLTMVVGTACLTTVCYHGEYHPRKNWKHQVWNPVSHQNGH